MRQLKDRIVHHFNMQPLSKKVIEEYLLFRMRAAGYHGPNIFTPAAINLIGKASSGLMRRVNILADKSLLAAFVENTHNIEARHVQAAIRDSEISPKSPWMDGKNVAIAGGIALSAFVLVIAGWIYGKSDNSISPPNTAVQQARIVPANPAPVPPPVEAQASSSPVESQSAQGVPTLQLAVALQSHSTPSAGATGNNSTDSLLQQRLAATKEMLAHIPKNSVSIQLYYTEDAKPLRIEHFLVRAKNLGKLSEIYIIPIKIKGKDGFRVLYGIYANNEDARNGMKDLPQRYKDAFAPTLNSLDSY